MRDSGLEILVHLAKRCRFAAMLRRKYTGTGQEMVYNSSWAEAWNALQSAKRVYWKPENGRDDMEQKLKQMLVELYFQVVEDVPPEVGSRHLWDTLDEVAQALNLGQSENVVKS